MFNVNDDKDQVLLPKQSEEKPDEEKQEVVESVEPVVILEEKVSENPEPEPQKPVIVKEDLDEKQEVEEEPATSESEAKPYDSLYDFTEFTQEPEEVKIEKSESEEESKEEPKRTHLSFHDFEEFPIPIEPEKEKGKKKFEDYFEQNRASQDELKVEKKQKHKEKKPKRLSRRKRKEIEEFDDIKKRRAYKYKRKKYTRVQDFVKYLNGHYLDLDEVADKVLADENFHGWLKKRSKRFDESIADFKEIVEKIGN